MAYADRSIFLANSYFTLKTDNRDWEHALQRAAIFHHFHGSMLTCRFNFENTVKISPRVKHTCVHFLSAYKAIYAGQAGRAVILRRVARGRGHFFLNFFWTAVSLCCSGWSAAAPSQLTAASTSCSRDPPASVSRVTRTIGERHCAPQIEAISDEV